MFERKGKGKDAKVEQLGSILHEPTEERPGDERQAELNAAALENTGEAVTRAGAGESSGGGSSRSSSSSSSGTSKS